MSIPVTEELSYDAYGHPDMHDDYGDVMSTLIDGMPIQAWGKPIFEDTRANTYYTCKRCGIVRNMRKGRARDTCHDCEHVTGTDADAVEGCLCDDTIGVRCIPCAKASGTKPSKPGILSQAARRQSESLAIVHIRYNVDAPKPKPDPTLLPKRPAKQSRYKDPGVAIPRSKKEPKIAIREWKRKPGDKIQPKPKKVEQTFPVYEWMLPPAHEGSKDEQIEQENRRREILEATALERAFNF